MSTVAILGLGLMGGSLARALAARGVQVLGYDRLPDVSRLAWEAGVLNAVMGEEFEGLDQADTVVLAVPVNDAPALLGRIASRVTNAQLITDVGSTKRSICAAAEALGLGGQFVGSHPFAGDHRSGWNAARADLFQGVVVYVCRLPETTEEALDKLRQLWALTGAFIEPIDAEEHDARLAWTSHLPQLLASATALSLAEQNLARSALGPGGRDVTRLAGSDSSLWSAIALDNADHLETALKGLVRQLAMLEAAISERDETGLQRALEQANQWFNDTE